jgi:hypothetical protein
MVDKVDKVDKGPEMRKMSSKALGKEEQVAELTNSSRLNLLDPLEKPN